MGNFAQHEQFSDNSNINSSFLDKLTKVSTEQFPQYGLINVYQLKQKPYTYFLQYCEILGDKQSFQQKIKFYKSLPDNKNIVPIQFVQVKKQQVYGKFQSADFCRPFDNLRIFCHYYNFTLENAIQLKIKQKNIFSEPDILYILKSLTSIGKFYQDQLNTNFYSGIFKTKNVFISPQGHLKIYPFNQKIYEAYLNKKNKIKQQISQSKLFVVQNQQKFKTTSLTRDESTISKSGFKSNANVKKSKLKTTSFLKKQSLDPQKTQQLLNLKGVECGHPFLSKPSNFSYVISRQQSIQSLSSCTKKSQKVVNRKDLFEFGILIMQILLLNDQKYYYLPNNVENKLKKPSQSDKVPNFDLIKFSLRQILPKKRISNFLINLIERLLGRKSQQDLSFEEIYLLIQKQQEINQRTSFCLRFQSQTLTESKNDNFYKLSGHYSPIKQKQSSINKADKSELLKVYSKNQLLLNDKQSPLRNQSTRLQSLLTKGNLSKSFIIDDESISSETQLLNKLKDSRKLIPHKIRSISGRQMQKVQKNQK